MASPPELPATHANLTQADPAPGASKSPTPTGMDSAGGVGEHRKVASTRAAISKSRAAERSRIGGRGKFRLLVAPASGERACAVLDKLAHAVDAKGWLLESTDKGYTVVADGETIGLMIEEKLDPVTHVATAGELKEKAEYDRKCELAKRGIGHRPFLAPSIPEFDYRPNGQLALKFDQDSDAGGARRVFSDGKRQRLEDLVSAMIESLEQWAFAVKARREERAQWQRKWAEEERRRREDERNVKIEGYRITFLQRQVERVRELDGLSSLIARWEGAGDISPGFDNLLDFARRYRAWLDARVAPAAIAERIAALKLMDDDVCIYDAKRLD